MLQFYGRLEVLLSFCRKTSMSIKFLVLGGGVVLGGTKRDKLNGTNGFLRKSAVSCGFLRKSAVSCGFLRKSAPPKCCNSQEKRKSAKICENQRKTANLAHLSLLVCPFYFPLMVIWGFGGGECPFCFYGRGVFLILGRIVLSL